MWGIGKQAIRQNGEKDGVVRREGYYDKQSDWAVARPIIRRHQPVQTSRPAWNMVRHLLEMVLAMVAGMMLLGGLVSLVALALGQPEAFDLTLVEALVMTVNMTIGMGLWMRYRGHSLRHISEMAGAMFLPLALLTYPFRVGLITHGDLMAAVHILMLPAMVGVMLFRRDIYTQHHHANVPSRGDISRVRSPENMPWHTRRAIRDPLVRGSRSILAPAKAVISFGIGQEKRFRNGRQTTQFLGKTATRDEKSRVTDHGVTERIARASARRPWLVVGSWVVLLVVGGILASGIGDVLTTEMSMSNEPESAKADRLIEERTGQDEPPTEIVIVRSSGFTAQDERFVSFVDGLVNDIRDLPTTAGAVSYYDTGYPTMLSRGEQIILVSVELVGDAEVAEENVGPLLKLIEEANHDRNFEVLSAGNGSISRAFSETSEQDLMRGEMIALPVALIILLAVFGAAVAAGIPLAVAVLVIVVAVGTTAVVGRVYELSFFVVNMITMIGLAVGIDYSLFIVQRYREERALGRSVYDAIGQAGATASRAVLFSGGTVVIGLVGLLIVPSTVYRSLAVGAVAVTIISVFAALTVLPATLSLLGDRINSLRLPFGRRRSGSPVSGVWDGVTAFVMRHPVLSTAAAVTLLLAAAIPASTMNQGFSGVSSLPAGSEPRSAFEILDQEFSAGLMAPARIAIEAESLDSPSVRGAIADLVRRLDRDAAFGRPVADREPSGTFAVVSVPVEGDPHSESAHGALQRLRGEHIPTAFSGVDAEVLVSGSTATAEDELATMRRYTPIVFGTVLGLSFLLLLIVFRSIIVPAKAILMNLLSVGAAYGLLVLVFQHGVGSGLLGFQRTETIEAWLPLFLFAVLFGLSMDYHVFLVSRIKERFDQTGDNAASVAHGTRQTAAIITGAAAIMVAVFTGFAMGNLASMQQMGFGLAVAVIMDATLIRSVLVPASMQLLGRWNWYYPSWLSWVPQLKIEGASGSQPIADAVPVGAGGR